MLIQFRTRGGPSYGWGNIYRLAAFAQICEEQKHAKVRFIAEGEQVLIDLLESRGFETVKLAPDINLTDEEKILSDLSRPDITVVEMLDYTFGKQMMLRNYTDKLVVFDDLLDHRYCADLVISGQELPHCGNRDISSPDTKFLMGYRYFPFHNAFKKYDPQQRDHPENIQRILVAFGGGHYEVAYLKAALALKDLELEAKVTFVLGPDAPIDLGKELSVILPNSKLVAGVENMAEELQNADLAIVSAGYLKLEAAVSGTPAIMVPTQWHQIPLAERFMARTGMPSAAYMSFLEIDSLRDMIKNLQPKSARVEQTKRCTKVIDTEGTDRILDAIFSRPQ
jgi:spore coat polysaccharide biosynthesis predicted glycosyltransferase SpsG